MKKWKIVFFLPFIISVVLLIWVSLAFHELVINGTIAIILLLFLLSGYLLSKGNLLGIILGFLPAIFATILGLQDTGQWINEITFAIPVYIFYIICYIVMATNMLIKDIQINKKTESAKSEIKKRKLESRDIFAIIVLCFIIYIAWCCFGFTKNSNIDYYNKFANEIKLMPETTEIGNYTNVDVSYYHKRLIFYGYDVYTLVATYDNKTYLEQKQIAKDRYIFEQEAIVDDYGSQELAFTIDGFNFNVISFEHYDLYYPQELVFVGSSDERCEIAYVYFYDNDLDYISEPLSEFLIETCKWKTR